MTDPKRSPVSELRDQIGSLGDDLREMAALRWELAQLEIRQSARDVRRLAIGLAIAALMAMTALPIFVVAAAEWLDGTWGIMRGGWLAIFGAGLLIGGVAVGYLVWRSFRRRCHGIEQTLEELREDSVWLKEWTGS